eukprot:TRINITY_DN31104_c0_g1_i1.p2 TRINITY_DN31104_c0_g1~~TRINITY_DN31104_c0_g1_i1.p2  ORF type:complete len:126 (+),score=36.70 TRINITY_DN31104_c0_g1_i1:61-438(+)
MGNCEGCSEALPVDIKQQYGHVLPPPRPLTTESMASAVKGLNIREVRRLIESGVNVNDEINEEGNTVLDMLLEDHARLMQAFVEHRDCQVADVDVELAVLQQRQYVVAEMLDFLIANGAKPGVDV